MAGSIYDSDLEKKIDLLLEQQEATQRAIAHLKADLTEIVKEAVKSAINRHQVEGYSKISGGI
jgi:hypothetical protein